MKLTLALIFVFALSQPAATRARQRDCDEHAGRVYTSKEVDRKARITRPSYPPFPEEAQQKGLRRGEVKLSLVFRPDGKVTDVGVVETSDESFTKASVEAAKRIRFEPAKKGGCPVAQSSVVINNYNHR
jgi:TonB family protein